MKGKLYTIFALEDILAQKRRLKYIKINMLSSRTGEPRDWGLWIQGADSTSWRTHLDSQCVWNAGLMETEEGLFVTSIQQRSKADQGSDSSS